MKLPGFVPEDLRQLVRFVPLRGWDAVEWAPMMRSLRGISWQYVSRRGVRRLGERVAETVPEVAIVQVLEGDLEELDDASRRHVGDALLRLYFGQLLVEEGLFLDLRIARLGHDEERLQFAPNGLWIRLDPGFRQGMLALYRSFYGSDEAAFDRALRQMGVLRDGLGGAAEEELKALLEAHFGVKQHDQRFAIDDFKHSFDELFEFFVAHDYRLRSDFVFVGFYLITLYLSLERLGQSHDVRSICEATLLEGRGP
ncbi:MAG: hypothetical protein AAGE01_15065 [Pseudomonadota bacterium]